jgi:Fe-Mn family superoxide dismutase
LALYKGYVTNTNVLTEQLATRATSKKTPATTLAYAELTRRLGFEYGGMVLHEYYLGNLAANGKGEPSPELEEALTHSFG